MYQARYAFSAARLVGVVGIKAASAAAIRRYALPLSGRRLYDYFIIMLSTPKTINHLFDHHRRGKCRATRGGFTSPVVTSCR